MINTLLIIGILCICGGLYWASPPLGVVMVGAFLIVTAIDIESKRKKAIDDEDKDNYATR